MSGRCPQSAWQIELPGVCNRPTDECKSVTAAYMLAGFSWCYMPVHLVEGHIAAGRLKRLDIKEHRGRATGRAGRWPLDDLRRCLGPAWAKTAAGG